ncbi:hypothetical protein ASPZODRAFT_19358 [Penicilliopsis zonata CBS 506.65]|uniref:Uncharacterized protein n=1 Tax=Penicilliopsis zonata CBS 506.65 TaxID=1073090 RepID=A0A1L9S904_9EURO|nr:hypothetical protein ASPZODRAFT_19358 [Penicilliopsis zonata CBS 506.65]OJJ43638.1 hypothetical protein ASPZODRAFT_19358 [Penicilliopsis zonata CBS 506.65]
MTSEYWLLLAGTAVRTSSSSFVCNDRLYGPTAWAGQCDEPRGFPTWRQSKGPSFADICRHSHWDARFQDWLAPSRLWRIPGHSLPSSRLNFGFPTTAKLPSIFDGFWLVETVVFVCR